MGRARGSEGLSALPKMAQLENGRAQNQLFVGLAQKSGLFLLVLGSHEKTQVKSRHCKAAVDTSPGPRQVGRRPIPQDIAYVSDVPSLSAQVLP